MLLCRANGPLFDGSTTQSLKTIRESRRICTEFESALRTFEISVGSKELRFNYRVQVDIMSLDKRPVIHIVGEATHFCTGSFLLNKSTTEICKTIQDVWNLMYRGPPDLPIVDQG